MSSRQFRKRVGSNVLPPPEEDSDGDYEPLFVQRSTSSVYAGLVLTELGSESGSPSQSDKEESENEEKEYDEEEQQNTATVTRSDKKKTKKRGKKKGRMPVVSDDMDEIDRSVQEVNAILGDPAPAAAADTAENKPFNWALSVLCVDAKHLNVGHELRRLFGPEEPEHNRRPRGGYHRAPYLLLKRVMVLPNKETTLFEFKNSGLSMSKYKDINDRKYFLYDHDDNYQKMHRAFLHKFAHAQGHSILMYLDEARRNMHVEALMEISDMLFRMEDNNAANDIVETVVTYLQYVANPLFIPNDTGVRLEYRFMENRPFHVAMLKYMYLLSNKACHRTALEIGKMLLLMDPSDPLAVLSVIDSLALRAREFDWLIEATKYFDKQREAGLLFNIRYSNALAHYHLAIRNKEDLKVANKFMQDAIMSHPEIYAKIMEYCNVSNKKFLEHPIFAKGPKILATPGLGELFNVYVKMSGPRWREPAVLEWLQKNLQELCTNYDNSAAVKRECKDYGRCRSGLFQVWPPEYLRHISVLSSISKLVLDGPINFSRPTCAWDPLFDKCINRYNYVYHVEPPRNVGLSRNPVYRFFQSMIPSNNYEPEPPVYD